MLGRTLPGVSPRDPLLELCWLLVCLSLAFCRSSVGLLSLVVFGRWVFFLLLFLVAFLLFESRVLPTGRSHNSQQTIIQMGRFWRKTRARLVREYRCLRSQSQGNLQYNEHTSRKVQANKSRCRLRALTRINCNVVCPAFVQRLSLRQGKEALCATCHCYLYIHGNHQNSAYCLCSARSLVNHVQEAASLRMRRPTSRHCTTSSNLSEHNALE